MLKEKIREWCIERAIELLSVNCVKLLTVKDVVATASAIEEYIWDKEK